MSKDTIMFFPVGNGDTILIKSDDKTVLTDIHYRQSCKDQKSDDYDFQPDLKSACKTGNEFRLSLFILTHPDEDHTRGFDEICHIGDPNGYDLKTGKILVEEIWCSPYGADPHHIPDDAKAIIDEIKRRKKLFNTEAGKKDGNRLKILDMNSTPISGSIGTQLDWTLLAPTAEEANIDKSDDPDHPNSSNNSSLVIRWTYTNGSATEYIVLGGDAEVDIWERIWDDFPVGDLKWSVLLAPHHCSRGSLARKNEDDKYVYSEDALSALGQVEGDGFIVSSSKEIKRNSDNPPSWEAKQKYLGILKKARERYHEDRFLNPDTHKKGKPAPVVFELSHKGIVLKAAGIVSASIGHGCGAGAQPTTYG